MKYVILLLEHIFGPSTKGGAQYSQVANKALAPY